MTIILCICTLLTISYVMLMLAYRSGWALQNMFILPQGFTPATSISVIIPARNEAENIEACITSILQQNYPKELLEIIVIDDHSTDDTAARVAAFGDMNVRCLSLAEYVGVDEQVNAYKKKALTIGIGQAKGELIVTTDADCTAGPQWLRNLAAQYEQELPVMLIAPVDYACSTSLVQLFQSIDFMSMQGITAAVHSLKLGNMCNGANLAFSKAAFEQIGGYEGTTHLASGDDYLLLMKMQKAFPDKIAYLKSQDAIVYTPPQPTWKGFLNQRIRWASKSGKYDDSKMTAMLALVYVFNLSFLLLAVGSFIDSRLLWILLAMLAMKVVVELYYLMPVAGFFWKRKQLWLHPVLQPLHILYVIIAGLLGFAGVYSWKGRSVK